MRLPDSQSKPTTPDPLSRKLAVRGRLERPMIAAPVRLRLSHWVLPVSFAEPRREPLSRAEFACFSTSLERGDSLVVSRDADLFIPALTGGLWLQHFPPDSTDASSPKLESEKFNLVVSNLRI